MIAMRSKILTTAGATALAASLLLLAAASAAAWQDAQPAGSAASRPVGTVKAISGNTITLTTDAKTEVAVQIQESTRLLRTAPGQRDLSGAKPMTLPELQVGDRMLARGIPSPDGKTVIATSVIVMTKADVAQKQERDVEDWNRRGVGGLVKAVDPTAGTVTISTTTAAGPKDVLIKTAKNTIIRRYAPDSVNFDDAKVGTLDQVQPGDQLRARGTKNADNTELAADEIVSGTFRNVAGLIASVDSANNTVTVNDLATKKPVTFRITGNSQMHQLPPMVAQHLAMRLKGEAPQNGAAPGARAEARPAMEHRPEGAAGPGGPGEGRPSGGDFAQILNRMPVVALANLAKGEAVMVVTTAGSSTSQPTAITLLSGVEPILTASPNGSGAASLLTPWSLGTGGAEAAAAGPQ